VAVNKLLCRSVAAALALLSGSGALAISEGISTQYGILHTDNVARTPDASAENATVHSFSGSGFGFVQDPYYTVDLRGHINFDTYTGGPFDTNTSGQIQAYAIRTLIRDRLNWVASDSLETIRINSLAPETPDNQEQVNRFATGPDLALRLSANNLLSVGARYERDSFQVSDLSNQRLVGDIHANHMVSDATSALLRYQLASVSYLDSQLGADYVADSVTAGFEGQSDPTLTYLVEAGAGRILRDNADDIRKPVGTLRLFRQITQDTGLRLRVTAELLDSARSAQSITASGTTSGSAGINTGLPDFSYSRRADIEYDSVRGFAHFVLGGHIRSEDFETSDLDVEGTGAKVNLDYEVLATLIAKLSADYSVSDYELLIRQDRDSYLSVGLEYLMRRRWRLNVGLVHEERKSSDPQSMYTANSVYATIMYQFSDFGTGRLDHLFGEMPEIGSNDFQVQQYQSGTTP
jgi:hypothetical protein